jgi:hypothetical protein
MCGYSNFTIGGKDAEIGIGYYGGSITIDSTPLTDFSVRNESDMQKVREALQVFTKADIINAIAEMLRNADE